MRDMTIVPIHLQSHHYDIHIGSHLLSCAGEKISPLLTRPFVAIVTDKHVAEYHLSSLQASLDAVGIQHVCKILPYGEQTKSFTYLEILSHWMLDEKVGRDDVIIALGGGVIGDLTGFVAAILRRGVRFVQIPTTLLAQIDSSVGGKTAIDMPQGKNLIGAFHQPSMVLTDIDVLSSLPKTELRAGYAEVVKYGVMIDREFFEWLEDSMMLILSLDEEALQQAIIKSCAIKADIVMRDEKENNLRTLLNLGHTFAHAYETLMGYSKTCLHGEAVSLGMVLALRLSVKMNFCPREDVDRLQAHLAAAQLPTDPSMIQETCFQIDEMINVMAQDKKVLQNKMRFILAHKIGDTFISDDVSEEILRDFLNEYGFVQ